MLVSFFWGTTWIASKEGVRHMPALQLVGIRQFIAGFLYVSYFLYKKAPWPKGKQWKTIFILTILNFVLSNALSTWGVKCISSGIFITLFRGEGIARLSILGLVVSFAGVCVIFYDYLHDFLKPDFRFGIFLSLMATVTWAFGEFIHQEKSGQIQPLF